MKFKSWMESITLKYVVGFMEGKNLLKSNKFKIFYIIGITKKYRGEEKFSIIYSLAVKYDDTKVQKSA